jgi:phospholipid transport system substrate-binding protein
MNRQTPFSNAVFGAAFFLLSSGGALANPEVALELVKDTTNRVLEIVRAEPDLFTNDTARAYALAEEIVLPHFDFERMSSWVLGKHWRTATAEQQTQFTEEFRNLLIRTYTTALREYSPEDLKEKLDREITYLPLNAAPDATDVTVKTQIERPGGLPIAVNYSLHEKDSKWKVYDVTFEGISLVTNYRNSFDNQIKREGLDALISKLAARSQEASTTASK